MAKTETEKTRRRYNRMALIYDPMEFLVETTRFALWRTDFWQKVKGSQVLELGVGTGKNIAYYPDECDITALDLSPGMLEKAHKKAKHLDSSVTLVEGDIQELPFADQSFDSVVASFVFCSVPDPIQGLQEVYRVLKPGGQLLLLEHVLSRRPFYRGLMNFINPLIVCVSGANINRDTEQNILKSGLNLLKSCVLWGDIIYEFQAEKPDVSGRDFF